MTLTPARWFTHLVVVVSLLSFGGCTTMQTVAPIQASSKTSGIKVGDLVEVHTLDNHMYRLKVVGVSPEAINGRVETGKEVRIESSRIASIQVEHFSLGKTILVPIATLFIFLVVAAAYLNNYNL